MQTDEAEMIKYLKNVFLSVKVGFFNELEKYLFRNWNWIR